ncbi:BC85_0335 family putative methyltransferase [Metamycoplasma sualvi]|uniref:BC85_0335 family putative methyltransferase n=1 Tax=Metamycoplasma sualvi TaxID=2125 RepID=UPI00387336F4
MDIGLRTFLIATAIAFPVIALIAFVIILFKIKQKRKEINASQQLIQKELLEKPSEQKMINRADFGKSDVNLQKLLKNSISHEIVEFCINTCIRNEYKNILMISNVELYESIVLSNKANVNVYVEEENFDINGYQELIKNNDIAAHSITLLKNFDKFNSFDAILVLNANQDFDSLFLKYEDRLKNNGMFIVANTKSNKKSLKNLVKEVKKYNYRYDLINWYTGFITIVKSFV